MANEKLHNYFSAQLEDRKKYEEECLRRRFERLEEVSTIAEAALEPHAGKVLGKGFCFWLAEDEVVLGVKDAGSEFELFYMEGLLIKEAKKGVSEEQVKTAQQLLGANVLKPIFFISTYVDRKQIGWARLVVPVPKGGDSE